MEVVKVSLGRLTLFDYSVQKAEIKVCNVVRLQPFQVIVELIHSSITLATRQIPELFHSAQVIGKM
ncbi:hypothetical protein ACFQE0_00665 [Methylobacterium komagatae]|uniref:Uncharacterized protein n=1 Tax=Methylobacterium komagatae TaxID=374425 RepID=A0ABW2BD00_9HYPH